MGWTFHYNVPWCERAAIEALCTFENEDRRAARSAPVRSGLSGIWRSKCS